MHAVIAIVSFLLALSPYSTHAKTAAEVFDQVSSSVVVVEVKEAKGDLSGLGLKAPAASLGSNKGLKTGGRVSAIGAPQRLELTLSDGIISSLRPVEGWQYIQITAPISKGSSGGFFDEEGRLIGLTAFYVSEGQNLNFAVPVEWTRELPERHRATAGKGLTAQEWIERSLDLEIRKDWQGLLQHRLSWLKVEPKSVFAWFGLGNAYRWQNQPAKAVEAFQQVLRIKPDDADVWCVLGNADGEQNKPAKAVEAYRQAVLIKPDYAEAWYSLALHIYCLAAARRAWRRIEY